MKRIQRLLYPNPAMGVWTPLFAAAIVITTAAVTLAAWPAMPSQQNAPAAERQKRPAETSSYGKWARREVAYIITAQERAAFQRLTTDEEREKFIEQFWERRNPNPGSPENAFKDEFYRRIAYTNRHFASHTTPGWKTDRGRIYIIYGPPDEIDSHPESEPYAFETWKYRFIDGIGRDLSYTFTDTAGTGELKLTSQPVAAPHQWIRR